MVPALPDGNNHIGDLVGGDYHAMDGGHDDGPVGDHPLLDDGHELHPFLGPATHVNGGHGEVPGGDHPPSTDGDEPIEAAVSELLEYSEDDLSVQDELENHYIEDNADNNFHFFFPPFFEEEQEEDQEEEEEEEEEEETEAEEEDDNDAQYQDYRDILSKLSQQWIDCENTHRASKTASNAFWDLANKHFYQLYSVKTAQGIKRKIPKLPSLRKKVYDDNVPDVKLTIGYECKETGEIQVVQDVESTPVSRFPPSTHRRVFEIAHVDVSK